MDDNKITITTDEGIEKEMRIWFTFHSEDFGKSYVVFYDEQDSEGQIYVMSYDETTHELFAVEDEKEWEMVEEMVEAVDDAEGEEESV